MKNDLASIRRAEIKKYSGFQVTSDAKIPPLRNGYFRKVDAAVAGDAPKDFLRVYEYGRGRKAHPESWPAYIANWGKRPIRTKASPSTCSRESVNFWD